MSGERRNNFRQKGIDKNLEVSDKQIYTEMLERINSRLEGS